MTTVTDWTTQTHGAGQYADVNGINLYYETHGTGRPLILLHGGQRDAGWMGEGRPPGGHALAILPGLTHYDVFVSPLLVAAATSFLDALGA